MMCLLCTAIHSPLSHIILKSDHITILKVTGWAEYWRSNISTGHHVPLQNTLDCAGDLSSLHCGRAILTSGDKGQI